MFSDDCSNIGGTDSAAVGTGVRSVLITGGSGFIGSAAAREFSRRGFRVATLDIKPFPETPRGGAPFPQIRAMAGDVLDRALVEREVAAADLVLHLAAVVGVDNYLSRPRDVLDVNILGTRNVLDACLRRGKPVLVASSSEVYGRNSLPLDEEAWKVFGSLANNRWTYAVSKAAGEEYAHSLKQAGLVYCIMRYFNVYGPGLDRPGEGRVVSKFLGYIRDRGPLPLVDGGAAVRSFCYVDDAVEATLSLALALGPGTPFRGLAVNIGRREPVTIRDLAERMIRLSGHREGTRDVAGADFFGPGFEEIPFRVPDVSLLRKLTSFEAGVGLEEGLQRTLGAHGMLRVPAVAGAPSGLRIPFVDVHVDPDNPLVEGIAAALRGGRLTNSGPNVRRLEAEAAERLGVSSVVAVSNGSAALLLAVAALKLGRGVAVLPSFTFIATVNAVVWAGLKPVFCDIDPDTFAMDPLDFAAVLAEMQPDVRLVVPVNVYGVPPDMAAVKEMAARAGVEMVLDAAHGFGTETGLRRSPANARMAAYSMHATKVLVAGEGGLIATADDPMAEEARRLRNHGLAPDLLMSGPGFNAKMTELEALVALRSLDRLERSLRLRREAFDRLRRFLLESCDGMFAVQRVPEGVRSNAQNLAVRCLRPVSGGVDGMIETLRGEGIEARRYFWPPLHKMRAFAGGRPLPRTDEAVESLFCLPINSRMGPDTLEGMERALTRSVRRHDAG